VKEAGAQYLKLVAPSNKAIAQYNAALEKVGREKLFEDFTAQDIRIVTRAASTLADANRAFGIGIQQARWPANATKAVEGLAAEVARDQLLIRAIAQAKTYENLAAAVTEFHESENSGSAELLRQQLGLPEVGS
jgi:hypothetical protein